MQTSAGCADRDAEFIAFVRHAQARLRRVAYLMCGDWHRAEDVVQPALVKLYRQWSRVVREADPWSYARRAVVNAAIDEHRRPWRRESATDVLPELAVAQTPPMDDLVLGVLSGLPAKQQAVVVRRYIEDLDVDTVAALLDMPTGTVKSHAARGLAALREHLTPVGVSARSTPHLTRETP